MLRPCIRAGSAMLVSYGTYCKCSPFPASSPMRAGPGTCQRQIQANLGYPCGFVTLDVKRHEKRVICRTFRKDRPTAFDLTIEAGRISSSVLPARRPGFPDGDESSCMDRSRGVRRSKARWKVRDVNSNGSL